MEVMKKFLVYGVSLELLLFVVFSCHAAPRTYEEHLERLRASVPSEALGFEGEWIVDYDDYTGDGTCEMVAFVCGDYVSEEGYAGGTYYLYYSSQAGLSVCDTLSGSFYKGPEIMKIGDVSLLVYTVGYGGPSGESSGWMCTDERLLPVSVPGEMTRIGENCFRCNVSGLDAMKPDGEDFTLGRCFYSYYYFFEDGMFKEYGGRKISETQFSDMTGAGEYLRQIRQSGMEVESIIYRKCGGTSLVYINCSYRKEAEDHGWMSIPGGTSFVYLEVVRTDDGWVSNGGWQDGNIKLANTPEVAVYPEI